MISSSCQMSSDGVKRMEDREEWWLLSSMNVLVMSNMDRNNLAMQCRIHNQMNPSGAPYRIARVRITEITDAGEGATNG